MRTFKTIVVPSVLTPEDIDKYIQTALSAIGKTAQLVSFQFYELTIPPQSTSYAYLTEIPRHDLAREQFLTVVAEIASSRKAGSSLDDDERND